MFLSKKCKGRGAVEEKEDSKKELLLSSLVYLFLMGYKSGYVFRPGISCVLRCDVRGRIYK